MINTHKALPQINESHSHVFQPEHYCSLQKIYPSIVAQAYKCECDTAWKIRTGLSRAVWYCLVNTNHLGVGRKAGKCLPD